MVISCKSYHRENALLAANTKASDPRREKIATLVQSFNLKDPQSCEAMYYSLFLNIPQNPDPQASGPDVDYYHWLQKRISDTEKAGALSKLQDQLLRQKAIYAKFMVPELKRHGYDRIAEEWSRRLDLLETLEVLHGSDERASREDLFGAFLDFEIPERAATGGDLPPYLRFSPGRNFCTHADVTLHGAEICTFDAKRKGAQKPKVFWGIHRLEGGVNNGFANAFFLSHEMAHLIDWVPIETAKCLASEKSIGANATEYFAGLERTIPRLEVQKEFLKSPGEYYSGHGTSEIVRVLQDMRNRDDRGIYDAINNFAKSHSLPDQVIEAAADLYATIVLEKMVQSRPSPAERKAAVVDILSHFPPQLFPSEIEESMNKIGSKPTNERRALRLILARKVFRDALGCRMAQDPAIQCDLLGKK